MATAADAVCFDSNPRAGRSGMALDSAAVMRAVQRRAAAMSLRITTRRAIDAVGETTITPDGAMSMTTAIPGLLRLRRNK